MTLDQEKVKVRQHLEAAVRLQRESWDQALAIEDVIRDDERDVYAFVAELAGGFKDNEVIPDEVIDMLMSGHRIESQQKTAERTEATSCIGRASVELIR